MISWCAGLVSVPAGGVRAARLLLGSSVTHKCAAADKVELLDADCHRELCFSHFKCQAACCRLLEIAKAFHEVIAKQTLAQQTRKSQAALQASPRASIRLLALAAVKRGLSKCSPRVCLASLCKTHLPLPAGTAARQPKQRHSQSLLTPQSLYKPAA